MLALSEIQGSVRTRLPGKGYSVVCCSNPNFCNSVFLPESWGHRSLMYKIPLEMTIFPLFCFPVAWDRMKSLAFQIWMPQSAVEIRLS